MLKLNFTRIILKSSVTNSQMIVLLFLIKFQIYKIINSKGSIDLKFEQLLEKIKEIIEKNIPTRKLSKSKQKLISKPWITNGILKSIKYKNRLYRMLCKDSFSNT